MLGIPTPFPHALRLEYEIMKMVLTLHVPLAKEDTLNSIKLKVQKVFETYYGESSFTIHHLRVCYNAQPIQNIEELLTHIRRGHKLTAYHVS